MCFSNFRIIFLFIVSTMSYTRFDSYYYSRPISYRSYYPRLQKQEISPYNDQESAQRIEILKGAQKEVNDLGGLARGIRFGDLEVGRRVYNHNSGLYYANSEFYIHQWKPTNDLTKEHPVGTHFVTKSF
jgi:hypothetical protein